MEAYTSFAEVYDLFQDNVPYEEWCEYLAGLLGEYGVNHGLVLDLGCGTGRLSFALAEISSAESEFFGVDLAVKQVGYAKEHQKVYPGRFHFSVASMDEIDFPDETFDLVMMCMALHEAKSEVRRIAIGKASRLVKPGGRFLLVDWGKPRLGLWGVLFYPFCRWGQKDKDNWNNTYKEMCESQGLVRKEDGYMNSLIRRQIFIKESLANNDGTTSSEGA